MDKDGKVNYRRYANTLDYSLDQIKLREVYEKVYRRTNFSFYGRKKEYTSRVINVTFKYSVAEFNKAGRNRYIRFGYKDSDLNFDDCVAIKDGELVGIILGQPVEYPVSDEVLGKYFGFEGGVYTLIKTPKTLKSTAELRRTLYNDGFVCNGIRYVRWKRSSGSSRVGKCLFIDEKLYARMHKWEMCGLKVAEGEEVDLAALESYISLPSSSIIDILEINSENILVIDDYESKFFDRVMSVSEDGDHLIAEEKDEQITNSIWDGQGLIDISAMGKYSDKGMILLRNLFFKCCCFNTNLQQWFADHGITEVSQLKGYTKAKRVEDIKIVTTPSSIKYLKFGTINDWIKNEGKFLIAVPDVSSVKKKRRYTHDEQVDLDVKTSNNLIGDIINLSQELNTRIWDVLNRGGSYSDIEEIYKDVCILNIMSGIEIDKAKKEFNINNAKELRRLRDKYKIEGDDGRAIKPNFFKAKDIGKGYYDRKRKNYKKHLTTMDHVQTCINSYRAQREEIGKKQEYLPFSALVGNGIDVHRRQYEKVTRVINAVTDMTNEIKSVYASDIESSVKQMQCCDIRQECVEYVGNMSFTKSDMVYLLRQIEEPRYSRIQRKIFNILFGYPNTSFYEVLEAGAEPIGLLAEDDEGDVELYGKRYTRYKYFA